MPPLLKRAQQAYEAGQCSRTEVPSKAEALRAIRAGEADAMSVNPGLQLGELRVGPFHSVLRFHDRELGDLVRAATIAGFEGVSG